MILKKGELTLRVGDEAMHFNLNDSLKQPGLRSDDYEFVETKIPVSSELTTDCNFQNSMNENEMIFQYLEHLEVEFLNSNFKLKDAVLERTMKKDLVVMKKKWLRKIKVHKV